MSKLTENTLAKIIACFLFTVSATVFVLSTVAIIILSEANVYFDDGAALKHSIYENHVREAEKEIVTLYITPVLSDGEEHEDEYNYLKERYSPSNTNISFNAETSDGTSLFSNSVKPGNRYNYETSYTVKVKKAGAYSETETETETITLTASIKDSLSAKDKLYFLIALADLFIQNRYNLVSVCIVSFIIALFLFVFMLYSAGHRKGNDGIYLEPQDKIPLDLYSFMSLGLIFVCAYFAFFVLKYYGTSNILFSIAVLVGVFLLCLLILLALILTCVTRIKYGKWWKNSVVYRVCSNAYRILKRLFLNLSLFWKTFLVFSVVALVELIILLNLNLGSILILWLVEKLIAGSVAFFLVIDMKNIKHGAEEIASGNTDFTIETKGMFGDFKKHADTLNRVNDGLSAALSEKMKSERLKTELITNVSHDLKTPLTSIVNYVDLMKKEDIQPERAKEYLEVLDRQSAKLKKLTLDLLEASKASSGNMKVDAEPSDINLFLTQLEGEYAEKLEANSLSMYVNYAENGTLVNADGRLLSRVFDNLMNNICKYTLPGTRVYITAEAKEENVEIEFKNLSKSQLNISGDELMERFVRGDSSRSTEGSGLGLSIAKSLTELQGGRLDIVVDGDLFKAVVVLNKTLYVDENGENNEE